ncbi:MAG: hypothetical protein ACOCP9_01200 [Halofilum sp. (in: g-proteobacteria)]
MNMPTDLADRVSPALARVLRSVLDDPEREESATLATARHAVSQGLVERMRERGELDKAETGTVLDELDALIEEYGDQVPLVHLTRVLASGPMSTLIRQIARRSVDPDRPITLDDVRAEIEAGLAAELVGQGLLDPVDEDGLGTEIDRLVRMHGREALAEELLGPEGDTPVS